MTKAKEVTEEFKPVSFENLVYDLPAVLYDSRAVQDVSFYDERNTPQGKIKFLAAFRLDPLTNERFLQREKDFSVRAKNKSASGTHPTEKLFDDLVTERIGNYKPRPDWKSKIKPVDKFGAISTLTHIQQITEEINLLDDEVLFDDDALTCLKFSVFYGGVAVEEWREWFSSGRFPENVVLSSESYESALAKIKKGIKPNILLTVSFNLREASLVQLSEAEAITFGLPSPAKLASAARDERTFAQRWLELCEVIFDAAEGYRSTPPDWHKIEAVRSHLHNEAQRLGKSLNDSNQESTDM